MLKLITTVLFFLPLICLGQCELTSSRTSIDYFTQECGDKVITARISNAFTLQNQCGSLTFNPPGLGGPIITSTYEPDENRDIKIDPNPFQNYLEIKMDFHQNTRIAIHNMTGQAIEYNTLSASSKVKQLDLNHLLPGFYIITIYRDDRILVRKKLIKI